MLNFAESVSYYYKGRKNITACVSFFSVNTADAFARYNTRFPVQ